MSRIPHLGRPILVAALGFAAVILLVLNLMQAVHLAMYPPQWHTMEVENTPWVPPLPQELIVVCQNDANAPQAPGLERKYEEARDRHEAAQPSQVLRITTRPFLP